MKWTRWQHLCLAWLLAGMAHATPPLRVGILDDPADAVSAGSKAVVEAAYKKIQVPVEFVRYPSRRLLKTLLDGEIDANLQRVAALAAEQPSLVRVDTPINTIEVRVYSLAAAPRVRDWSDLNGRRVAFVRGVLVIERNLPPGAVRVEVGSDADLLRMLPRDMADIGVVAEPARNTLNGIALPATVQRQDKVLEEVPLYHYLHGRHAELAVRLDTALRAMQASGEADALRRKALKEFYDKLPSASR